jgi:hypothetical protein
MASTHKLMEGAKPIPLDDGTQISSAMGNGNKDQSEFRSSIIYIMRMKDVGVECGLYAGTPAESWLP